MRRQPKKRVLELIENAGAPILYALLYITVNFHRPILVEANAHLEAHVPKSAIIRYAF